LLLASFNLISIDLAIVANLIIKSTLIIRDSVAVGSNYSHLIDRFISIERIANNILIINSRLLLLLLLRALDPHIIESLFLRDIHIASLTDIRINRRLEAVINSILCRRAMIVPITVHVIVNLALRDIVIERSQRLVRIAVIHVVASVIVIIESEIDISGLVILERTAFILHNEVRRDKLAFRDLLLPVARDVVQLVLLALY